MRRVVCAIAVILAVIVSLSPALASSLSWSQLRDSTGLVVFMRHAIAPGTGDPANLDLRDCATQRNLSAEGREQARDIGMRIRAARVPVAAVVSSPWCRALDTARILDIGPVTTRSHLGSSFRSRESAAESRARRTKAVIHEHASRPGVLFLIGHQVNILDVTGVAPSSGEAVVVRSDGRGGMVVLGTIPAPR